MARAFNEETKQAAKSLHLSGMGSGEIRAKLMEGKAGLKYTVEPSERTIDGWRQRWKRHGEFASFSVGADEMEAVEEAIYRRILGLYMKEVSDLEEDTMCGKALVSTVQRVAKYQAICDAAKYQRVLREKSQTGKLTPQEGGHLGKASAMAKPESML